MDSDLIRTGVENILRGLGRDLSDPNFRETPDRVVRAYRELFAGLDDYEKQVAETLSKTFPCTHSQMVVIRGIQVFSYCPHHLLPVAYSVTVGYMPGESEGSVVGISKPVRLVEIAARRPVLQETMVNDITEALMRIPGCAGSACVAEGEHSCMRMRGVRQHSTVVTSSLRGVFLEDPTIRAEFLSLR